MTKRKDSNTDIKVGKWFEIDNIPKKAFYMITICVMLAGILFLTDLSCKTKFFSCSSKGKANVKK